MLARQLLSPAACCYQPTANGESEDVVKRFLSIELQLVQAVTLIALMVSANLKEWEESSTPLNEVSVCMSFPRVNYLRMPRAFPTHSCCPTLIFDAVSTAFDLD